MNQGEKIFVIRCTNGWLVQTDLRAAADDTMQVAATIEDMLALVRAAATDDPATPSAEGSGRVQ